MKSLRGWALSPWAFLLFLWWYKYGLLHWMDESCRKLCKTRYAKQFSLLIKIHVYFCNSFSTITVASFGCRRQLKAWLRHSTSFYSHFFRWLNQCYWNLISHLSAWERFHSPVYELFPPMGARSTFSPNWVCQFFIPLCGRFFGPTWVWMFSTPLGDRCICFHLPGWEGFSEWTWLVCGAYRHCPGGHMLYTSGRYTASSAAQPKQVNKSTFIALSINAIYGKIFLHVRWLLLRIMEPAGSRFNKCMTSPNHEYYIIITWITDSTCKTAFHKGSWNVILRLSLGSV